MASDLRSYLSLLQKQGELVHVKKTVSAKFELAAVVSKFDGKQAVMFEKVKDSKMAIASNVCGTARRFCLAVGSEIPKDPAEVKKAINSRITQALSKMSAPGKATTAQFEQNSSRNLYDVPIVTHFEKDAGAFVTASIVFAKDGERGNQNSSTHRLLRLDEKHMAIRMVEGRHLHKCFTYARDHGEDLKVAIAVGVHPAVSIAASVPGGVRR
ncbi:UbiD family decarboxylase domain-containing protein [Candidatus Nitrososphaera sp. FF02]|uniref:UbiD family decarboxylase domain-containing protein n=1 Tax=Candidatus Nitrososphaera sp. FF02 TaxID=3398226 RepID=UPI0039E9FB8B